MPRRLRLLWSKRRPLPPRRRTEARSFALRHRFLLVLLWAQVPVLAAVGLARVASIYEVTVASLLLVFLAVVGIMARSPGFAAAAVGLGLVTAAGILVRYLDGSPASAFAFFLAIVAVSFYEDWRLLLLATSYVAGYHLINAVVPGFDGSEDPFVWPLLHLAFTVVLALLLVAGWRLGRKAEDRAAGGEDGFRLSFERAPMGMAVLTPSGEFLHANRALSDMLGYEEGHLIGANLEAVVDADDHDDLGQAWLDMGRAPERVAGAWLRCRTLDGRAIWGRTTLSRVPGTRRQSAFVLLQLEDATQGHQEQRRLEDMIRGRDEFVAAIGEEIREPISAVLDLTAHAGTDPIDLHRAVGLIETQAREIAAIADDLIVSARAGALPVSVVPRSIDTGLLCREALAGLSDADNVPLALQATSVWADPSLTERILSTLVANALRYGGTEIRMEVGSSGPDTVIRVIDDGPGIPLPEQERIFNGDLRSGAPVTRPAAVGLGLTVARHLAREMDGELEYRRTTDGHNVFELRLPSEPLTFAHGEVEAEAFGIPA